MTAPKLTPLSIAVGKSGSASGLLLWPAKPLFGYVLAHGAGAGMRHPFLTAVANRLAERNVATLRYQYPYMEAGGTGHDTRAVSHAHQGCKQETAQSAARERSWLCV